ncbi:MAG TPA: helicase-related protein, partial [Gemmatimonadales bacterium]|nr:helicase-related protein [Gemmatimonadales bacterium]
DEPPEWLLPHQRRTFRRVLAGVRRYGGALLADPPGTGKTYIALATAAALEGRATCLVPASLRRQWLQTADRVGLPVTLHTHEQASRGGLPRLDGLVIIDESHRLRNTGTRRHHFVARSLTGHSVLLLSATPVVNRLSDLTNQLALFVPDDRLAPLGVSSLSALPASNRLPPALSCLVHVSATVAARPDARKRVFRTDVGYEDGLGDLDDLELSTRPAVAGLLRGVIRRAAASSPAALDAALRRYRLLLLHARDAAASGGSPDRAALRRWVGELPEQTVLWPLLADHPSAGSDLALGDLPRLDRLIRRIDLLVERPDARAQRLAELLRDQRRTLVFTCYRDTALWLRRWIEPAPAWCTGAAAGIGHIRMPRDLVLAGFGPPGRIAARGPQVLVTTDVTAEGLDLQGASRVVHYDLPWTPARLDQRVGRAQRLGGMHPDIEVVRMDPPAALGSKLHQVTILASKRRLPERALLAGRALERWRRVMGVASEKVGRAGRAAVGHGQAEGVLAGVSLVELGAEERLLGTTVFWIPDHGAPDDSAEATAARMEEAQRGRIGPPPTGEEVGAIGAWIEPAARSMLLAAHQARWQGAGTATTRRLVRRIARFGRAAAGRRDELALALADRAIQALCRGHTTGETLLLRELEGAATGELVRRLATLAPRDDVRGHEVRIAGFILFRSHRSPLP